MWANKQLDCVYTVTDCLVTHHLYFGETDLGGNCNHGDVFYYFQRWREITTPVYLTDHADYNETKDKEGNMMT